MVKEEESSANPADSTADGSAAGTSASPDKPQRERKRRLDVNPDLIISSGRSKRRRTPTPPPEKPEADPQNPERAKTLGLQLFNKLMNMVDSDGESMAEPYITLPSKREFPDYYETIKHPMSLEIVQRKLESGQYTTLGQVCADVGQIWNNAKRYNMSDSLLFQWARIMHKVTRNFLSSHTNGHDGSDSEDEAPPPPRRTSVPVRAPAPVSVSASPNATAGPSTPATDAAHTPRSAGGPGTGRKRGSYMKDGPTVYKLIKPCVRAIKETKADDGTGRDVAMHFMALPDRRTFPDYYKMVKNPLTLNDLETRMMARRFDSAEHFFEEAERMCDNALLFNEDGSEVWRDAHQIRGIIAQHRNMVRDRLTQPRSGGGHIPRPVQRTPQAQVTPVRHGQPQMHMHPGMMAGPGGPAPPLANPHSMMLPPGSAYGGQTAYGFHTPASHPQALPHHSPQQHFQQPQPAPYVPQLPHGVVTEEVVTSLDRYPAHEQQAWAASLPPLAQGIYRQIVAVNEARKRGVAPPPPPPVADPARPPEPAAPTIPTIRHIDFSYGSDAIRLQNLKGVVNHAVAVAAKSGDTFQVQLTAWVDSDTTSTAEVPQSPSKKAPEVALRVNGTPASGNPTPIYTESKEQPAALRWTVPVRGNEAKLEVVATKPGSMSETSAIFVNRQY